MANDPLPSWNDGPSKQAILAFVAAVTDEGGDLRRTFAEETYGIPGRQTIGSGGKVAYSLEDGVPTLTKLPEVHSIDDMEGKPINIYAFAG